MHVQTEVELQFAKNKVEGLEYQLKKVLQDRRTEKVRLDVQCTWNVLIITPWSAQKDDANRQQGNKQVEELQVTYQSFRAQEALFRASMTSCARAGQVGREGQNNR